MSRRPDAQTPDPVPVEAVVIDQPVVGIRNPPCCGQPGVPRLARTRVVGATRLADGTCPHCGHRLRITYERSAEGWTPVLAVDLMRKPA